MENMKNTVYTDAEKNVETLCYDDFGALGDGVTDDYVAIYRTHVEANATGKKVLATSGKTYYLECPIVDGEVTSIPVKTDVDWQGAKFIIDDRRISQDDDTKAWGIPVFDIMQDAAPVTLTADDPDAKALFDRIIAAGLNKNTKKIDLGDEYRCPVMIVTQNATHKIYRRQGYGEYPGVEMKEVIILGADGSVREDTPVMYDYIDLTGLTITKLGEVKPITVENGEFTTRAPQFNCIYVEADGYRNYKSPYISRGLHITRSYTTVKNVKHYVTDEVDWNGYVDENHAIMYVGSTYRGFYCVGRCTDVTIKDCVLTGRRCYRRPNGGTGGTYDLSLGLTNNVVFDGCVQSNFWVTVDPVTHEIKPANEGDPGAISSMASFPGVKVFVDEGSVIGGGMEIGAQMHWGIGGTNLCKNTKYINSILSRYDAHEGTYGGEVRGSTVSTIALTGAGDFYIEDTKTYSTSPFALVVRSDYGYTWDGTVHIKNLAAIVKASSENGVYTDVISVIPPRYEGRNWYWGYHPTAPNLVIEDIVYYDFNKYDAKTGEYKQIPADVPIYLYGANIAGESMTHLKKTTVEPSYSLEDKDGDGYVDIPDIDADGVWGNTEWKYDDVKEFLGRGYWRGLKPSVMGYDVKTEDGLYENFSIINPPEFAKILGNKGGYTYYVRNTAKSGLSNGGHHGVEENNKGFYGSTKFYYGEGEEDFYQGPPSEDEKCPDEELYAFFD